MPVSLLASLPMYDVPGTRAATDELWSWMAERLRREGLEEIPGSLAWDVDIQKMWLSPQLLLGQTCGFPLTHELWGKVRLVGTPCYGAAGCEGPTYRSLLVARDGGPAAADALPAAARWAVNGHDSLSGYWLAIHGGFSPPPGCAEVTTGGHIPSLRAVAAGDADFAWIDCVTHALVAAHCPGMLEGVRVIGHSGPAPALPFITALGTSPETMMALRDTLGDMVSDLSLAGARETLLIDDFEETSIADYEHLVGVDRRR